MTKEQDAELAKTIQDAAHCDGSVVKCKLVTEYRALNNKFSVSHWHQWESKDGPKFNMDAMRTFNSYNARAIKEFAETLIH